MVVDGTGGMDGADVGGPRQGGQGGVWFSLIDKVFAERTLRAAAGSVVANGGLRARITSASKCFRATRRQT